MSRDPGSSGRVSNSLLGAAAGGRDGVRDSVWPRCLTDHGLATDVPPVAASIPGQGSASTEPSEPSSFSWRVTELLADRVRLPPTRSVERNRAPAFPGQATGAAPARPTVRDPCRSPPCSAPPSSPSKLTLAPAPPFVGADWPRTRLHLLDESLRVPFREDYQSMSSDNPPASGVTNGATLTFDPSGSSGTS